MNTNQYIQAAMTAIIENEYNRALGLLMRAVVSYDDDIDRQIVADANEIRAAAFSDGAQDAVDRLINVPNDQPRVYADEVADPDKVEARKAKDRERKRLDRLRTSHPEMVPLKPKKVKHVDVSCPSCGAKPGKPCIYGERSDKPGELMPSSQLHNGRRDKARAKS